MRLVHTLVLLVSLLTLPLSLTAVSPPSHLEKVYLHFDNTAYFMGETIWFKSYVVQAGSNGLSQLSKTLYVELVSPDGAVIESKKIKLTDGKGDGFFKLEVSLAGYYQIRAYTRFALNQGEDAIFSRVFTCYDKPKQTGSFWNRTMVQLPTSQKLSNTRIKQKNEGAFYLGFFPEGGHMVEGLTSNIAFKAIDKKGEQASLTGVVVSERGDTLATLKTSHQGMGSFLLTPSIRPAGTKVEKLMALVDCDNKHFKIPLPEALPSGYVLTVDNSNQEQVSIQVQRSTDLPEEPLGIDLTSRGILYGKNTFSFLREDALTFTFPTRQLPSGVTQITLHSMDGRPLAERCIFVNHHPEMSMDAIPDKHSYRPYEPINIDFSLNDNKGNPVETDFSLSVKDAASSPFDAYADNILTNLLLSSELKGHIASPGYYFVDDSLKRRNDLDLLMLTQGWTRYDWKRVAGIDSTPFHHPYEESLLIEGNVYTLYQEKEKEGVEVKMTLLGDSISQHGTCMTDTAGRFNLKLEDFYGTNDLVLETITKNGKNKEKRKEHIIRLDRYFSPPFITYEAFEKKEPIWPDSPIPFDITAIETDSLQEPMWTDSVWVTTQKSTHSTLNLLPEVQVNARRRRTAQSKIKKDATVIIDAEKAVEALKDTSDWVPATKESLLFELLPYLGNDGKYKGKKTEFMYYNQLGFKLEGEYVEDIYVRDIELVTVKEGIGIEPEASDPSTEVFIYIYAKMKNNPPIGIRKTKLEGYSLTASFYSPPYDQLGLPDPDDVRRTLYWNPSVKTDTNGKARVSFYNNRSATKLTISAETVTNKGKIGALNQ